MLKCLSSILVFAMACQLTAMAQPGVSDTLLRNTQCISLPASLKSAAIYSYNPATMPYRDSISLSEIRISGEQANMQKPIMEQLGTGYTQLNISAQSYRHLSQNTTVWGKAEFVSGKTRDVRWNNCIDYLRVAPYVLGDEVGGDLNSRRYSFNGGYAGNLGRFNIGLAADYRAEIAYRNRDPRLKTVVSDLSIRAGATYHVNSNYVLGFNSALNVYSQNCDLEFYNPINDINTYTLTGLGTWYQRFMGNTNKNSGYESFGLSAALQFVSINHHGFMGNVIFNHYKMEEQLRNFNNITLAYSNVNTISAHFAYRLKLTDAVFFQPALEVYNRSLLGTENLFGTSAGTSYDKIGSRSIYRHNTGRASGFLSFQFRLGHHYCTLTPYTGFSFSDEEYIDPYRKLQTSHFSPGLQIAFSAISGKWLWEASIDGSHSIASAKEPILTGLDTTTPLAQCVTSNFNMLKADITSIKSFLRISKAIQKIVFDITLNYSYFKFSRQADGYMASLSIGARF